MQKQGKGGTRKKNGKGRVGKAKKGGENGKK